MRVGRCRPRRPPRYLPTRLRLAVCHLEYSLAGAERGVHHAAQQVEKDGGGEHHRPGAASDIQQPAGQRHPGDARYGGHGVAQRQQRTGVLRPDVGVIAVNARLRERRQPQRGGHVHHRQPRIMRAGHQRQERRRPQEPDQLHDLAHHGGAETARRQHSIGYPAARVGAQKHGQPRHHAQQRRLVQIETQRLVKVGRQPRQQQKVPPGATEMPDHNRPGGPLTQQPTPRHVLLAGGTDIGRRPISTTISTAGRASLHLLLQVPQLGVVDGHAVLRPRRVGEYLPADVPDQTGHAEDVEHALPAVGGDHPRTRQQPNHAAHIHPAVDEAEGAGALPIGHPLRYEVVHGGHRHALAHTQQSPRQQQAWQAERGRRRRQEGHGAPGDHACRQHAASAEAVGQVAARQLGQHVAPEERRLDQAHGGGRPVEDAAHRQDRHRQVDAIDAVDHKRQETEDGDADAFRHASKVVGRLGELRRWR
eukprot:ctg_1869.g401